MCYTCCMLAIKPLNRKLTERRKRKEQEQAAASVSETAHAAAEAGSVDGHTAVNQQPVSAPDMTAEQASSSMVQLEPQPTTGSEASRPRQQSNTAPALSPTQSATQLEAQPAAQPAGRPAGRPTDQPEAQPEVQPEAQLEAQPAAQQETQSSNQPQTQPNQDTASQPKPLSKEPKERKKLTKAKKAKKVTLSEVDTIIPSSQLTAPLTEIPLSLPSQTPPAPGSTSSQSSPKGTADAQSSGQQSHDQPPNDQGLENISPLGGANQKQEKQRLPPYQEPTPPPTTRIFRAKELIAFTASQLRLPSFGFRSNAPPTPQQSKATEKTQGPERDTATSEPTPAETANIDESPNQSMHQQHFDGSAGFLSMGSSCDNEVELFAPKPRRPLSVRFPFMGAGSSGTHCSHSSQGSMVLQNQSSKGTIVTRRDYQQLGQSRMFVSSQADMSVNIGSKDTSFEDDMLHAGLVVPPNSTSANSTPSVYYPARTSPSGGRLSPPTTTMAARPDTEQLFQADPVFAADGNPHELRTRSVVSTSTAAITSNHLVLGNAKMPAYKAPTEGSG